MIEFLGSDYKNIKTFMKKIFEAIHEESVRQQMEIINK